MECRLRGLVQEKVTLERRRDLNVFLRNLFESGRLLPQTVFTREMLNEAATYLMDDDEADVVQDFLRERFPTLNRVTNTSVDCLCVTTYKVLGQYRDASFVEPEEATLIRESVYENIVKNAVKMVAGEKRCVDLKVGDHVTIKVPPQDRHKTWPTRMPATVVKVSGEKVKKYVCACKFGLLEGTYNGGSLEANPAGALPYMMEPKLSLRSAMRKLNGGVETVCQCRKGCKNDTCKCRKAGYLCSSRCHKKTSCTNSSFREMVQEGLSIFFQFWGKIDMIVI